MFKTQSFGKVLSWLWAIAALLLIAGADSGALAQPSNCTAVVDDWQAFETRVRDGSAPRADLQKQLDDWPQRLKACFANHRCSSGLAFPLPDYGPGDAGRDRNGADGFVARGYTFLDGNRHGGHPAIDFFVHDRNQDSQDDRTGRSIGVLALANGVVLSVFNGWQPQGPTAHLRGGNYVWIFHPDLELFSYYAHLGSVLVSAGRTVATGEPIGVVGRSGANAYKKRSPTHLHLMLLNAKDMRPVSPMDLLQFLGNKKR